MEMTSGLREELRGTPAQGLFGATLGFFIGFAAVSLFGPTARYLESAAGLTPALAGLLISIPNLSGSLLRIPFSAMVDTTGGRRPFLILLGLSILGLGGISVLLRFESTALAGMFPLLLSLVAIPALGLEGSYLAWFVLLVLGTGAYALLGRNSWYFQLRQRGFAPGEARRIAGERHGQELFPKGRVSESLKASAAVWQTWALVGVYFTTFGGFMALTGWLPRYWAVFHGTSLAAAGLLTGVYSILASLTRVAGGRLSDRIGGTGAAGLALLVSVVGAVLMSTAYSLPLAVGAILVMAVGMGIGNAAVFKMVPEAVPEAVGGAAGWIGGLGAFGGFVIPNLLAAFVPSGLPADPGYARGFAVFVVLDVLALGIVWILHRKRRKE